MTNKELVIVLREFHLDETYFFSLFLNTRPYHSKCLCDNLFNVNETQMKLPSQTVSREFQAVTVGRIMMLMLILIIHLRRSSTRPRLVGGPRQCDALVICVAFCILKQLYF
jgi:hypothetical protein